MLATGVLRVTIHHRLRVTQPGLIDILKDLSGLYCSTKWLCREKPMVLSASKSDAATSIASRAIGTGQARQLNQERLHGHYHGKNNR